MTDLYFDLISLISPQMTWWNKIGPDFDG
jgi:hypothetical protein